MFTQSLLGSAFNGFPVKDGYPSVADLNCGYKMTKNDKMKNDATGVPKTEILR